MSPAIKGKKQQGYMWKSNQVNYNNILFLQQEKKKKSKIVNLLNFRNFQKYIYVNI